MSEKPFAKARLSGQGTKKDAEKASEPLEKKNKTLPDAPTVEQVQPQSRDMVEKEVEVTEKLKKGDRQAEVQASRRPDEEGIGGKAGSDGRGWCFAAFLGAGFIGGVMALLFGIGLQRAGVVSMFVQGDEAQLVAISTRLDKLGQDQDVAMKMGIVYGGKFEAAQKAIDANGHSLHLVQNAVTAIKADAAGLKEQVTTLEKNFSALKIDKQATAGLSESEIDVWMQKVTVVEKNAAAAVQSVHEMQNQLTHYEQTFAQQQKQLVDLQRRFDDQAATAKKTIALLNAADVLREAILSGTPYQSDLERFIALSLTPQDVAPLKAYAESGLPNTVQLLAEFSPIADKIVLNSQKLPKDPSFMDKLRAYGRHIIVMRPMGMVSGQEPDAIVARIEVAIGDGDYGRALSEWQNLPEDVRKPFDDFVKKLIACRDAKTWASQIVSHIIEQSLIDKL
ncbi:COG4223 family protein [Bartonella sp. DGB2]|uniref:COG4223 family protein n=1 Tax=Bartonella sp. DGB2 TaxID=3388426 RepID=UPI00398FEBC9